KRLRRRLAQTTEPVAGMPGGQGLTRDTSGSREDIEERVRGAGLRGRGGRRGGRVVGGKIGWVATVEGGLVGPGGGIGEGGFRRARTEFAGIGLGVDAHARAWRKQGRVVLLDVLRLPMKPERQVRGFVAN